MHADRAPVLGALIAVALLAGECIGLVAYTQYRQAQADRAAMLSSEQRTRAQAVQDAIAAKAKLDAAMEAIQRNEEWLRPLDCQLPSQQELRERRRKLKELRLEQERLRQILSRERRSGERY